MYYKYIIIFYQNVRLHLILNGVHVTCICTIFFSPTFNIHKHRVLSASLRFRHDPGPIHLRLSCFCWPPRLPLPSLRDFRGMSPVAVFPPPGWHERVLLTWEPPMGVAARVLIIDACLLNLVIYASRVCTTAGFSLLGSSRWLIEKLAPRRPHRID